MYYQANQDVTMPDGKILIKKSVISEVTYNGLPPATQAMFIPDTETTFGSPTPPPPVIGNPASGTPTISNGTNVSGTTIVGDNYAGKMTFVTNPTAPAVGSNIVTITFNPALPTKPKAVLFTAANMSAMTDFGKLYIDDAQLSAIKFVVKNSAATALPASYSYQFYYHVIL